MDQNIVSQSTYLVPSRLSFSVLLLNVFTVLTGAYGVSLSSLILLRWLFGEPIGFFGLFSTYLHLLMLPALVLVPITLLTLNRWLVLTLLVPFGLFVITYGRQFLPRSADILPDAPRLTIVTFNLHNGNMENQRVADVIRQANADIVALQELDLGMAGPLEAQLADLYPYRSLHPEIDFTGQGVFSRYPINHVEVWQTEALQGRYQFDLDGTAITLYNVHAAYPFGGRLRFNGQPRTRDVNEVLERAVQERGSVLIVGDFNMTDMSADYGRITAVYADTYREIGQGMGFSFPAHSTVFGLRNVPPLARIDYIFHSQHFAAVEAHVGSDAAGSDHLPLFASLALGTPH
jgi:vancomycin resistance protein VanJ